MTDALSLVERDIVACRACPRLVAWRESAAASPPRRFASETYWARAVPGFGDPEARVLVVGLAPAAHGGNRTGRVFTGDSSGDFLFRALHRAGFASQPTSVGRDDGLVLGDCYVAAAARCAPPDNRPTPEEFGRCRPFLVREIGALSRLRVVVALGGLAWEQALRALGASTTGRGDVAPRPAFSHGGEATVLDLHIVGSYHVSRQNTNTGRLTAEMFDSVWKRVRSLLDGRG